MVAARLDPIDRKILAELQADGRMTNVELAKRVGISAPPCLRRVRTLEEAGLIRGYHADVNSRELGFEVQVFAMVGLDSQAETDLNAFEDRCRSWPLVRECHMLNGEVDFHPEMRRAGPEQLPELSDRPIADDAECRQRQDIAGDPRAKDEPGVPFDILEDRLSRSA